MASQLGTPGSYADRAAAAAAAASSMFPSAPGFPPMWPSFDPLRPPVGLGSADPMALFQWQQRMRSGGPMGGGLPPDMFRGSPFLQQFDMRNQSINEQMMRLKAGGFSPGPPPPLFSPQLSSLMRSGLGDQSLYSSPPGFDPMAAATQRRSPTPAKTSEYVNSSSARKETGAQQNGKDSPTDLSKSRGSNQPMTSQSQSGKDSASPSSGSTSSVTKSSSKSHHGHAHHNSSSTSSRHSPSNNGESTVKLDKDKIWSFWNTDFFLLIIKRCFLVAFICCVLLFSLLSIGNFSHTLAP